MRKVLVTGGCGKLGQWVVRALRADSEVRVFDRAAGGHGIGQIGGDILDESALIAAMQGIDVVVHLAGVPKHGGVPDAEIINTNVVGTYRVHEVARKCGVRRVVSTSSEAALGWDFHSVPFLPDYLPVDERHRLRPQDSYGLSKQLGEQIAASFASAGHDMETLALRPSWTFSPEEMQEMTKTGGLIPHAFSLCSYIDVRDLAEAYRLSIECELSGFEAVYVTADDPFVGEPLSVVLPRLLPACEPLARGLTGDQPALSNERAKELLGWAPTRSWRHPATAPSWRKDS